MSDDRADRLRDRRQSAKERATDERSEPSEPSKPSKQDETDEPSESSVKDERVGTYMYLPPDQKEDVNRYYSKISGDYEFEFGRELEKNRHWYPLVVEFGLDALRDADAERIDELLEEAELR